MEKDYFSVSYDIRNGGDYKALYGRLEELKAERLLESTWVLGFNKGTCTCEKLMNDLLRFVDERCDRVFISLISEWCAFRC